MTGTPPEEYPVREQYELSPGDARAALDHGAMLIDCRTDEEWNFARVDGALHVPLSEIERRADELQADASQLVLVMCHHGVRSLRAAIALQQLGFPSARSIVGGIDLWSQIVDPSIPRYDRTHAGCRPL